MSPKRIEPPDKDENMVAPEFVENVAHYFEQVNRGEFSATSWQVENVSPETQAEWQHTLALLQLPAQAANQAVSKSALDAAWQQFQRRAFNPATASLGAYVTSYEQQSLRESGLPETAIEALKADNTPLADLKRYRLKDYASLARQHKLEEQLFPKFLNWLKGLGKSFSATSGPNMVFARPEQARPQTMDEAAIIEQLQDTGDEGQPKG